MSQNNRERVGKGLDRLNEELRPFVERQMRSQFGASWEEEARKVLPDRYQARRNLHLDIQALLRIMLDHWNTVFRKTLGSKAERIKEKSHQRAAGSTKQVGTSGSIQ